MQEKIERNLALIKDKKSGMTELQEELKSIADKYVTCKRELDKIERKYNLIYARQYLQERITGLKTEEMRKNEMICIMENEHAELLNQLQEQRGITREYFYKMEALKIILGAVIVKE